LINYALFSLFTDDFTLIFALYLAVFIVFPLLQSTFTFASRSYFDKLEVSQTDNLF